MGGERVTIALSGAARGLVFLMCLGFWLPRVATLTLTVSIGGLLVVRTGVEALTLAVRTRVTILMRVKHRRRICGGRRR